MRSFSERKAILKKAASILRENLDAFAKPITLEMGKLFTEAQSEVQLSADILDYFADNAEQFLAPKTLQVKKGEAFSRVNRWASFSVLNPGIFLTINWHALQRRT